MRVRASGGPENKIMQLLENNLMSTSQLAKELDMRRDVLAGYLEALMHQGKLVKMRVGRSDVYLPAKNILGQTRRISLSQ